MELSKAKKAVRPILNKHGVKKAAFFGSIARGEMRRDSDIDIIVELGNGKTLLDLVGLKIDLEEKLRKEVDVLTPRSIHPLLREKINKEKVNI